MSSQIITPPDHLPTKGNIVILNALEQELATLVMWLKTVPEEYNIHIYHSGMVNELEWILKVCRQADFVVLSNLDAESLDEKIIDLLSTEKKGQIFTFGPNAQYTDLIQFFLDRKENLYK
jgi:hypothetical protein